MKIINHLPVISRQTIQDEIFRGLTAKSKMISSKFFYNSRGSQLFDQITRLDEYYLTRTEVNILKENAKIISSLLKNRSVIELGSGDAGKISILFNSLSETEIRAIKYYPVDVSKSALKNTASSMRMRFPGILVNGIIADFVNQIGLIEVEGPKVFCFFGSTLGNFNTQQALGILKSIYRKMNTGDCLILGLDRVKDSKVLHKAYNDSKGITAEFNLNILNTINKLCGADFDTDLFEHHAVYNPDEERIEMYLTALEDQVITSSSFPYPVNIKQGELIHTENSHKYSMDKITAMVGMSEFKIDEIFSDGKEWFSLFILSK